MKVLLTTLNSKYIHSCLAIRYLKSYVEDVIPVEIQEYTINQNIDLIVSEIFKTRVDAVGFSTYIWNLTETLEICETLKIIDPDIKIILGGPEVTYDGKEILEKYPFVDFLIYGEGEVTFRELILDLDNKRHEYKDIKGLVYREGNRVVQNPPRPLISDLNIIPSPYRKMKDEFQNKIVYFESSRGCPFNCEFCLSSTIKGVRYFDIERVKEELGKLIDGRVRQVKFVDRTFNANKKYAMEIMNYIIDKDPKDINFHFEVTAHLLDEEMLNFLSGVKEGLFQFEIGVQSTNPKTIEAVGRNTDFCKLREVSKRIKSYRNIHQHLDLIAGLPYEDYKSFRNSFNDVYEIRPEKIQLGFLKLLKGSGLRGEEEKYGFKYLDKPPYEVLKNDYISYGELSKLKEIEELVEKYFNEGYFENAIEYIVRNKYDTPFDFYEDYSDFWEEKGYYKLSNSRIRLYEILMEFYEYKNHSDRDVFRELLRFDFIINNRNSRPPRNIDIKNYFIGQKEMHQILKSEEILNLYLEDYKDLPTKRLIREVAIENFKVNIFEILNNGYNPKNDESESTILFDYKDGVINRCKAYDITNIIKELM